MLKCIIFARNSLKKSITVFKFGMALYFLDFALGVYNSLTSSDHLNQLFWKWREYLTIKLGLYYRCLRFQDTHYTSIQGNSAIANLVSLFRPWSKRNKNIWNWCSFSIVTPRQRWCHMFRWKFPYEEAEFSDGRKLAGFSLAPNSPLAL